MATERRFHLLISFWDLCLSSKQNQILPSFLIFATALETRPAPRVIVTDKLRSYLKPIKTLAPNTIHRSHKRLNNRAENSHLPIRRREKAWIKMKSVTTVQKALALMGATRNLFAINVGRYQHPAWLRKFKLKKAFVQWNHAFSAMLVA